METECARAVPVGRRAPAYLHRLLLGVGTVLVLLLLGSSLWQATASLRALDDLRQHGERLEHIDSMLIQLMDVEGTVRSYLLSGNRDHLAPYQENQATVRNTLELLRQELEATPEGGDVLDDLSGLVARRLEILDRLVTRQGRMIRAKNNEQRHADDIRSRLAELKEAVLAENHDSFERSAFHVDRARRMVAALALGTLALMVALFVVLEKQFRLREQLAGMLRDENRRLDALVRERTEDLNGLASYLTEVREIEKERLARELHDELGALLTAAKFESGWLAEHPEATAAAGRDRLERLQGHLDRGIALKRRIIDDLRPPFLEELGLVETLRILGEDFADDGDTAVRMELPDADLNLTPPIALALFRIAQEALTNIRKHAHARSVTLALHPTPERVRLEIVDDGVGVPPRPASGSHHGLKGMQHRVQMCAGTFGFSSQPGSGTRITADIPWPLAGVDATRDARVPVPDRSRGEPESRWSGILNLPLPQPIGVAIG